MHLGVDFGAIVAILLLSAGCSQSGDRSKVAGTWVYDSGNSVFSDPKQGALVNQVGSEIVYGFRRNGTFTQEPGDIAGTYRLDGSRVLLRVGKVQNKVIGTSQESGFITLSPDGSQLTIYSRDDPREVIALKRSSR